MTTPELPPLDLHCESGRAHAAYTPESVEARERILVTEIERLRAHASALAEVMAMIHGDGGHYLAKHGPTKAAEDAAKKHAKLRAECEAMRADAERYRWLASKARKDTAYDRYGNGAAWSIGFFAANGRHALDAAIDAAREAKP